MNIRHIIFDLGGVLLNVNYEASIKAFQQLGVKDFDVFFTKAKQGKLFDQLDRGEITPGEFRDAIRQISSLPLADRQIDEAWNAMLMDLPAERIELLEGVKKHYRTFLLSNTNAIHYPIYSEYLKQTFGYHSLSDLFEKEYLSYQIGMRKPDTAPFELVLKENGLDPRETLFIDDTMQHVEGARKAGLNAVWLDLKQMDVSSLFSNDFLLNGKAKELAKNP